MSISVEGLRAMLTAAEVERLNDAIGDMDRPTVIRRLRAFQAGFPIDFSPEFYATHPLEQLRHILFGLCLHEQSTIEADDELAIAG